uniref:Uncharacterized protein n=1 Tax=Zea mays TaxID=4577 RepID=B4FJB6_MAIZE|nr:unknown [Zea mays]
MWLRRAPATPTEPHLRRHTHAKADAATKDDAFAAAPSLIRSICSRPSRNDAITIGVFSSCCGGGGEGGGARRAIPASVFPRRSSGSATTERSSTGRGGSTASSDPSSFSSPRRQVAAQVRTKCMVEASSQAAWWTETPRQRPRPRKTVACTAASANAPSSPGGGNCGTRGRILSRSLRDLATRLSKSSGLFDSATTMVRASVPWV